MAQQGTDFAAMLAAGLRHQQAGRLAEARRSYEQVLRRDPRQHDALHLLGMLFASTGELPRAIQLLRRALAYHPDFPEAWNNLAVLLAARGENAAALDAVDRALARRPDFPEALATRGDALLELGRLREGLASLDRAIALRPAHLAALNSRGNALLALRQPQAAHDAYAAALALDPANALVRVGLGNALLMLRRMDAALACYETVLRADPEHFQALHNAALLHQRRGNPQAALALAERGLARQPHQPDLVLVQAAALRVLGRIEEARASFEAAMAAQPGDADLTFAAATFMMQNGPYRRGLALYEQRWRSRYVLASPRRPASPAWDGKAGLAGKRLLLLAEQGLGDTLQFCRFAPRLAAQGATVLLQAPAALLPVLASLSGVSQLLADGATPPAHDLHAHLMSLPWLLGLEAESTLWDGPYLSADPSLAAAWAERLGPRQRPRIGLAWRGNPRQIADDERSAPLAALASLLALEADFFALHHELRDDDTAAAAALPALRWHDPALLDLPGTAALMTRLDLVIAVDSALGHLAGAQGLGHWLMLPPAPDWRWPPGAAASPWYPRARLLPRRAGEEWEDFAPRLAAALAAALPGLRG